MLLVGELITIISIPAILYSKSKNSEASKLFNTMIIRALIIGAIGLVLLLSPYDAFLSNA